MPITVTQDIFKVDAVDVRHINPSIMEGEHLYTGIIGPDAAVSIERYAPTFLVNPTISGNFLIPSRLTCNPGVIDASPQPNIFFQWRADGVDIPGETKSYLDTVIAFDQVTITCYVLVVNQLGFADAETNGITAERLEPVRMEEHWYAAITGLSQKQQINTMRSDVLVVTGIAQYDRLDFISAPMYFMTGMWVEERLDAMTHIPAIISGLGAVDRQAIKHEVYTVENPDFLGTVETISGLGNWTVTAGVAQAYLSAYGITPSRLASFIAADVDIALPTGIQNVDFNQTNDIPVEMHADIDLGIVTADAMYTTRSRYEQDYVWHYYQFLDVNDVVLSTHNTINMYEIPDGQSWDLRQHVPNQPVPALARKIKHFVALRKTNSGNRIDSFFESAMVNFYKPDEHT